MRIAVRTLNRNKLRTVLTMLGIVVGVASVVTMIALGTGVAWSYSVIATFFPQIFPAAFHQMDGAVSVYFEAAAVITTLVLLGQVLELRARSQTGAAIRAATGRIAISLSIRQPVVRWRI